MEIKWESNSRVKHLASLGKIKPSDIIPRTQTDNFPAEATTVRMSSMDRKVPFITAHIRGKAKKVKGWNGRTYEVAQTCRVNFGGDSHQAMNSNGDLDDSLTWMDVHNIVTKIKEAMEIE
jgi:hypothetical protein|tara:strand:- start:687 stop:1046 length:360 start_codon:yes stop_codon:yes gene_type:complete